MFVVFLHECRNIHVTSHMWKPEDSIQELALPFHLLFFTVLYLSCFDDAGYSMLAGQ